MNQRIVAEANFLQDLLYKIYVGREEWTVVNWNNVCNRLQAIRDEAKKK